MRPTRRRVPQNAKPPGLPQGAENPLEIRSRGRNIEPVFTLPNGFEYSLSECGRGWSASEGMVALNLEDSYAHWVIIDMNQHGVIR